MTPRYAAILALLCTAPVTLWLAGQIMLAAPGSPGTPYWHQAVKALGLVQAMVLAVGIPLLADRRALPPQLMAAILIAAAPWPLYALAVLADALCWSTAVGFAAALTGLVGLIMAAMVLGLRRVARGVWELPVRFTAAAAGGLLVWGGWHQGLHRLMGQ